MKFYRYIKLIILFVIYLPVTVNASDEIVISKTYPQNGVSGVVMTLGEDVWIDLNDHLVVIEKSSLNASTVKLEALGGHDNLIINYFKIRECNGTPGCKPGFGFDSFKRPGAINFDRARLMPNTIYRVRILNGIYGFKEGERVNITPYSFVFTTGSYNPEIRVTSKSILSSTQTQISWETEWPTIGDIIVAGSVYNSQKSLLHSVLLPSLPMGKMGAIIKCTDNLGNMSQISINLEVLNIFDVKSQIQNEKAVVTFKTSRQSKACIRYGISENLENVICDEGVRLNHELSIPRLLFGENIYYFRIEAEEVEVGKTQTGIHQFKTTNKVNIYTESTFRVIEMSLVNMRLDQTNKSISTSIPISDEKEKEKEKKEVKGAVTKQEEDKKVVDKQSYIPNKGRVNLMLLQIFGSIIFFVGITLFMKRKPYKTQLLIFFDKFIKSDMFEVKLLWLKLLLLTKKTNTKINNKIDSLFSEEG